MKGTLNIYKRIILQILLFLGCYFLSRLIFTCFNGHQFRSLNVSEFLSIAFAGLRYDISAFFAVNSLYILMLFFPFGQYYAAFKEKIANFIFIFFNSIALAFEISDWAYFSYNQKRATADIFDMMLRKADFVLQMPSLLQHYWYIPLFVILFILLLVWVNHKIVAATSIVAHTPPTLVPRMTSFVFAVAIGIVGFRGGLQYVPIGIRNAVEDVEHQYVPILLNTPFSIVSSLSNPTLKHEIYFDKETLQTYINTTKQYASTPFQKKNVVIIILESFSKEFTGIGGMKSYTPFLDSLMQQSHVCTQAFANGNRSAEAIPAILSGIPSITQEPFTTSIYGANKITSIANLLSQKGYSTAFYHGGNKGTMSFDLFAKNAGFQRYIGRDEYANDKDYDGAWGIWDEPFLQFCNKDISKQMREPFVASIFTLSAHQPYAVPSFYAQKLPKGTLPIHQPVAYTDRALSAFFHAAAQESWYANTLFVLVADHCSPLSEDDYYHYHQGRFAIPIIYFSPKDSSLKGHFTQLSQQIDILPSVMDYLGYQDSFFAFGNSIFTATKNRYTIQQWSGNLLWTMNNRFLRCNYDAPDALFAIDDKLCTNNLFHKNDSLAQQTIRFYKAFRQSYTHALIDNKLWIQ